MPKEIFVPSDYDPAHRGRYDTRLSIESFVIGNERRVQLCRHDGHVLFDMPAKDANLLGVKLFGMSENHKEELPPMDKIKPGTLVKVFHRGGYGVVSQLGGGYPGNTQKISASRAKTKEGYIRVIPYPGMNSVEVERKLVSAV